MKKVVFFAILAVSLLSLSHLFSRPQLSTQSADSTKSSQRLRRVARPVKEHYIVALKDEFAGIELTDLKARAALIRTLATEMVENNGGKVTHIYRRALLGFSATMTESAATALSEDPRIKYIEEDGERLMSTTQFGPPWGLDRIDQRSSLDYSYTYNQDGRGVNVYIIDSGILPTHDEFGGRAKVVFDAFGGNGIDCNGHGTHVAGIIGGKTYGVAKNVNLYSLRVFDCSASGLDSNSIAAIDWVTAHHVKPAVVNMSLGGEASTAEDEAINRSIAAGVTYVVAAGNGDASGNPIDAGTLSPARVRNAITVAATDQSDNRASFSNYGDVIDLFAPGENIVSAWIGNNSAVAHASGTSMATPHVAGVAALYLQTNPTATPAGVQQAIINEATLNQVINPGPGSPNRLLFHAGGTATANPNNAAFITQNVPAAMTPGQRYNVSITMKNTGTTSWTPGVYTLGAQNPADTMTWGFNRLTLPATIAAGQQIALNFTVTAPATAGNYNFQWQMLKDSAGWFGSASTNVVVKVGNVAAVCNYAISPTSLSIGAGGGSGSAAVTSISGCNWTAGSNVSWITITAGSTGSGNGSVSYKVAANTSTSTRTGIVTIANKSLTVSQSGTTAASTFSCNLIPISAAQSITGALSSSDCRSPIKGGSFFADRYTFTLTSSKQVSILLRSASYNTMLYLIDQNGTVMAQNYGGGGTVYNSRIPASTGTITLPAGQYTLETTSTLANKIGTYSLTLSAQ